MQEERRIEDRRCGYDRRTIAYDLYIPDRRKNKDRRSGMDRRKSKKQ